MVIVADFAILAMIALMVLFIRWVSGWPND
jgi:hypothetical protein